jgi:hypothetical protein
MRTQGIERAVLEKNLVFGLAELSPIFAIDNRIYYCSENASPDTFISNRRAMSVNEGPSLDVLENISEHELKQDYEEYQKRLIRDELEKNNFENNKSYDETSAKLIKFTMEQVFPNLRKDDSESLDKIFKIRQKNEKEQGDEEDDDKYIEEVQAYVLKRVNELQRYTSNIRHPQIQNKLELLLLNQNLSKSSVQESLLLELMGGYNFAIVNNTVYNLANVSKGEQLNIKGIKYALVENCSITNLRNDFVIRRIRDLSIRTLKEHLLESEEFAKIRQERKDIDKICMMENYEEQDFGFIKNNDGTLTVYVQVPDYVLQSIHGDGLYNFSGHRLGIKISFNSCSRIPSLFMNPYSLDPISGPFYHDRGGSLCMGGYRNSYMNNMERGKAFAKLLTDARNIVLRGYTKNCGPYHHLENYPRRKISPEQVKKRGLKITNINYESSHKSKYENRYDDY